MSSAVLGIQGHFNHFGGLATSYPGEHITFTLENNVKITDTWRAYYNNPGNNGPFATGGDFYNFFVLGLSPASYKFDDSPNANNNRRNTPPVPPATTAVRQTPTASVCNGLPSGTRWSGAAYPTTDIAQPELATSGGEFIGGHFFKDAGIAVLSIPDSNEYGGASNPFSKPVKCSIESSKSVNLKIIIDVQQNQLFLAIGTFRQVRIPLKSWDLLAQSCCSSFHVTNHGPQADYGLIQRPTYWAMQLQIIGAPYTQIPSCIISCQIWNG